MENGRAQSSLGPILTATGYFVLAVAALLATRSGEAIATMWPAGGLAVAVLASVDPAHRSRHAIAVAFASMAANAACGTPLATSVVFTAANLTECLVAVLLLSRCPYGRPSFIHVRQVACFCAIAGLSTLASTSIASAAFGWSDWRFALAWFTTDLLGILITAPLAFMVLDRMSGQNPMPSDQWKPKRFALTMAGVAVVSLAVFAQSTLPLMFVPVAALILAAYATGPLGAATGTMIVALVGSVTITNGHGPTTLMEDGSDNQAYFFQFYLVVLMACSLSIAALQTAQERLVADLTERTRLLFMAERVAKIGHWHLDLSNGAVTWSKEVYRLHGLSEDHEPDLESGLAAYHEDDREGLTAEIDAAIRAGGDFQMRARILRADGQIRHVDISGETILVNGIVRALFGVVQDVTNQVEIEQGLEESRQQALTLASEATRLAETDVLTGLANRRRVLDEIAEAVGTARTSGAPCALAIFDIDHFKRVNDTFGHETGDAVLRRVASTATAAVRRGDLVGRLGGEEFVVIIPGADRAVALAIAERMRTMIETGDGGAQECPPVTISIGLAVFDGEEDGASLLRRADRALYRAKADGRNLSRVAA
ncbi:sensor domain-containing diguanylate cyclase [Fulvimarina endophytica]|uniref:diguanylate cyclase n=1 Tax=Fulvimarina endophytica TaxID=2293836 RepID=A0A371X3U7_9HYPH|nr:sensor domain-containing diguanylate cyclase [Fulvimarina endophytica]RFC63684.1 sensor domain-containing diguanylate cyclase [Fulvimarina endophytica]